MSARTSRIVYRRFVEFEERAAGLYVRLASRFSPQNHELSALWLEMAMEEKQHAGLLQFCSTEDLFTPDLPKETEIRKFSELFRNLEKRAADPALDVNGAFALALELEGSEVNAIYSHLTTPLHRSLYLLRRKIAASPADHIDRLLIAGKKFGVASRTLTNLGRLKESCPKACF